MVQSFVPITKTEWMTKANADNSSDNMIACQSGMTGWMTAQGGQHVMVKLGENTDYELNDTNLDTQTAPTPTLEDDELEYDGPFGDRDFDVYAEAVGQIESGGRYDALVAITTTTKASTSLAVLP